MSTTTTTTTLGNGAIILHTDAHDVVDAAHGTLLRFNGRNYVVGTDAGYAADRGSDSMSDEVWIIGLASTLVGAGQRHPNDGLTFTEVRIGQRARLDGRTYTIERAPNNNLTLEPAPDDTPGNTVECGPARVADAFAVTDLAANLRSERRSAPSPAERILIAGYLDELAAMYDRGAFIRGLPS